MISDDLIKAALDYRRTKLWTKIYDSQIFAVQHSDGSIGYCCVMGKIGELNALALYHGREGLNSLRMLHDISPEDDFCAFNERMHCQQCLIVSFEAKSELSLRALKTIQDYCARNRIQLRGKNAFPEFEALRAGYERWYLEDEVDQRYLQEALEAAIEVSYRLQDSLVSEALPMEEGALDLGRVPMLIRNGSRYEWELHELPPRSAPNYPVLRIGDDMTAARLRKARRLGYWAAKVFMMPQPLVQDNSEDGLLYDELSAPPFYPFMLLIVNAKNGLVYFANIAKEADYSDEFIQSIVDVAEDEGLPHRLMVSDERTKAFFREFCDQNDIRLDRRKVIQPLEEAFDKLMGQMSNGEILDEEDDLDDEELEEMFAILSDPKALKEMPDEMFRQIKREMRVLPDEVQAALREEAARRGMKP